MKKIILLFVFFGLFSLSGCAILMMKVKIKRKAQPLMRITHQPVILTPVVHLLSPQLAVFPLLIQTTKTKNSTIISTNQSLTNLYR